MTTTQPQTLATLLAYCRAHGYPALAARLQHYVDKKGKA